MKVPDRLMNLAKFNKMSINIFLSSPSYSRGLGFENLDLVVLFDHLDDNRDFIRLLGKCNTQNDNTSSNINTEINTNRSKSKNKISIFDHFVLLTKFIFDI